MATEKVGEKGRGHIMKNVLAHGKEFGFYFKCSGFNHFTIWGADWVRVDGRLE